MGIDFDTYLVDEVTSVGDAGFKAKSQAVFRDRMRNASAVVVSHSMSFVRRTCTMGAVLHGGRLSFFEDVNKAIPFYERLSLIQLRRKDGILPPEPVLEEDDD